MYKLITLATLLLGLALAPVLSGSVRQDGRGPAQTDSLHRVHDSRVGDPATSNGSAGEAGACEWRCEACEAGQGCSQTCTEIGNCGSTCNVIARCDTGYVWDEDSCSCLD